jgi:hypothetical protein
LRRGDVGTARCPNADKGVAKNTVVKLLGDLGWPCADRRLQAPVGLLIRPRSSGRTIPKLSVGGLVECRLYLTSKVN